MNDYELGIRRLEKVFGKDALTVRVFERDQLVEGDVVTDFLDAMGIKRTDDLVTPKSESNQGLSWNMLEIKRMANYSPAYQEQRDNFLREVGVAASTASPETQRSNYFSDEQRDVMLSQYAEGNAHIAREYLHREDGVLFREKNPPAWEFDPLSMQRDMILFFTEALVREREERKKDIASLKKWSFSRFKRSLSTKAFVLKLARRMRIIR